MMHEGIDGQPVMSPGAKWQLALIMHLSHGGGSLRELYVLKCRNEGLSTYWDCKPGMPLGKICSGMPMTYDDVWPTDDLTDMPATCMSCHGLLHDCCMKHSTRLMAAALHEDVNKSIQEENNTFVMILRSDCLGVQTTLGYCAHAQPRPTIHMTRFMLSG